MNGIVVDIDPVAFSLFGLDIYRYAIIIVTGMILGVKVAQKELVTRGFDEDLIYDIIRVMLPLAIVGARLRYVAFEWDSYKDNPISILYTRQGGMAIHGGILGGFIGLQIMSRKKKIPLVDLCDIIIPSLALGQAIGRWGNFMNMEAHGGETNLPWAMIIDGVGYHPTFLYESIGDLLIFIYLYKYKKREPLPARGKISAIYFMSYGVLRYFVEGLRTDSLRVGTFRTAQLVSIAFVIIGAILYKKSADENLPPFRKKGEEKSSKEVG